MNSTTPTETVSAFSARVISLRRTPERLARFRKWNAPSGIRFHVFQAIDGRELRPEQLPRSVLVPGTSSYTTAALGSALSHGTLWRQCAVGNTPFLICEDDAALRTDAATAIRALMGQLPAGWDMICLGYNADTAMELDLGAGIRLRFGFPRKNPTLEQLTAFIATRNLVGAARLVHFFGLCAYVLSPQGAKRLLNACFPLDDRYVMIESIGQLLRASTFDSRINAHLAEVTAYAAIPPIALPDNDPARSAKSSSQG
jgi:glycosyl transferase family 25